MATTTLTIASNRLKTRSFLIGSSVTVPVDASVAEIFILPTAPRFGQLFAEFVEVVVGTLSGTYVAVAPATEGAEIAVVGGDGTSRIDGCGSARFVNVGTVSARPQLVASWDLQNGLLIRQQDQIIVGAPVIGGAGVTATVSLFIRGIRFMTE